ncbi:MAG: hypothetical protein AAB446_01110 [Patescibacteria group bacterium]
MRKMGIFLVFLVILAFSGVILANEPPEVVPSVPDPLPLRKTHVEGSGQGIALFEHGTDVTGGFSVGNNSGAYNGDGSCDPLGQLNLLDFSSGASNLGEKNADSFSSVFTDARVKTVGTSNSEGNIQASFRQANWAEVGNSDENNFSFAGNNTGGALDISQENPEGDVDLCGIGGAGGNSNVSMTETATSKEAYSQTSGGSFAETSPGDGTRLVDGSGGVSLARELGQSSDPVYAYGGATGLSNYSVITNNPTGAAGTVNLTGNVVLTHEGNSVTSTVNQRSGATIIPCGGDSCPH